ncbi:ABC-type multidrug transport system fused ATPase/permease subunit [Terracoccus luteus]|uniref:ABC-type multidrug transport system fused ATPase/permease subunit n=1 Tax=Terracoccus luteus TaxID=53356 RepID=A0A495XYR9_9MICO|nr:ABC transporter ATP-binding protein [Terracoccus luteus]RKT78315.1 ABC-type multidrug transport system fused ATPase/permease subunit [Terracoccus luteus]
MRDFPPVTRAFGSSSSDAGSPGHVDEPDTRTPRAFLAWMVRQQGGLFWFGLFVAVIWMVPQTLGPWIVGRAIDTGIVAGDQGETTRWLVVLGVVTVGGALSGVFFHTVIVREWLIALYGTTQLVTRKALQLGHVLTRRTPTGEVLSVSGSDGDQFGALMEITTRAVSQLLAYLVVAGIVLSTSVRMGLLVLVSAPLLVLLGAPLLRPMQRWQGVERSRNSELTSMATDIVAGLRILRGIGGEETFGGNYAGQSQGVRRAGVMGGRWLAAVESVGVLLSGGFVVALLWLGTREVAVGRLTVGELVSFLGYGLFLVQPMRTFVEFAQKWTRSVVSARKAVAVYEQRSPWRDPVDPKHLRSDAVVVDEASGVHVAPGRLTMVVSSVPDDSAALADRLGRYLSGDQDPLVSAELPEGLKGRAARAARAEREAARAAQAASDEQRASEPWGVTVGGVDLSDVPLDEVRRHIFVSDTAPQVFKGTLREAVDPHDRLTREQAERALFTAAADDVFDALPGGWQGELDERGRGLSGGQRQRLVLMRALAVDPEVLVLVEPTSAVDAHTEARIAERLGPHRAGRTTVVMTASPLLLHHADEVALMVDGREVDRGRHAELLSRSEAYRSVVVRGEVAASAAATPADEGAAGGSDPTSGSSTGPSTEQLETETAHWTAVTGAEATR